MRKYLNDQGVPLAIAVFLAHDSYDHEEGTLSATKLIKPTRQIVLGSRVPQEQTVVDVNDLVKSRLGTAIHDGIENVWLNHSHTALKDLGYPPGMINRLRINPDPDTVTEDDIPVYLERREYRSVLGYTVSGKYDFVAEGRVQDTKTTSVFTWITGNKDEDYQLQGSIYRWLNPKIITDDHMAVNYIFTDFQPARSRTDPKYPPKATPQKLIPLLSVDQTDAFIRNKLTELERYWDAPQEQLPRCTDKELWRSAPVYKYYKNPDKRTRATKNFDTSHEAYERLAADGGKGVVIEQPGEVIACKYCPAFPICTQKDDLIAEGSLKL